MLNELPKKEKPRKPTTKWRLFWRIQKECALRAVTPFMMYLFCSLIALAFQALSDETEVYEVVIGAACILLGAALNAPMGYLAGQKQYDSYPPAASTAAMPSSAFSRAAITSPSRSTAGGRAF